MVRVEVALPIVGLNNSCQATIQSYMSLSIRSEDKKVGSTRAPTNLVLDPIYPCNKTETIYIQVLVEVFIERPKDI